MGREQEWVDHVVFVAGRGALRCVPCGLEEPLVDGRAQLDAFLTRHAGCQLLVSARRRFSELQRARAAQQAKPPRSPPPRYDEVWLAGQAAMDAEVHSLESAPPASSRPPAD